MTLPSFDNPWKDGQRVKPRILVLEVKDKNRLEAEALDWVLVEREETYKHNWSDGKLCEASIKLSYQCIKTKSSSRQDGRFNGSYLHNSDRNSHSVSLTSADMSRGRGAVFLDPDELRGQRIGTYLMNEIVQWAKSWPEATVNCIELLSDDEKNKARRNWFYEQFGIKFKYADSEQREGVSRSMLASELKTVEAWTKNIVEYSMPDCLAKILNAEERATSELQELKENYARLKDELKQAEAQPLCWALRLLHRRHGHIIWFVIALSAIAYYLCKS